jgi:hypothetical protein
VAELRWFRHWFCVLLASARLAWCSAPSAFLARLSWICSSLRVALLDSW